MDGAKYGPSAAGVVLHMHKRRVVKSSAVPGASMHWNLCSDTMRNLVGIYLFENGIVTVVFGPLQLYAVCHTRLCNLTPLNTTASCKHGPVLLV